MRRAPESTKPNRKRLWRWGAAASVPALVLAYFALPWLIPGSWVAERLAADLSVLMNRSTTIESLRIDARDGLILEGLRIERRPGFDAGPLFTARRVQLPIASGRLTLPARLIGMYFGRVDRPLAQMIIQSPELWVVSDAAGRLNIADLNDRGGARLPALAYDLHQLGIHFLDLRSDVELPQQHLEMPRLVCDLDPQTGQVSWSGAGGFQPGKPHLDLQGTMSVPRLLPAVSLAGGGVFSWTDLDLSRIPRFLVPWRPFSMAHGLSSGRLQLNARSDLAVDFELDMSCRDLRIAAQPGDMPMAVEALNARLEGRWDPSDERVQLSALFFDSPGLGELQGVPEAGAVVSYEPLASSPVTGTLRGRITDLARLTDIADDLSAGWGELALQGQADFEVSAKSEVIGLGVAGHLTLSENSTARWAPQAAGGEVSARPWLNKPGGEVLEVEVRAVMPPAGLALNDLEIHARHGRASLKTLEPAMCVFESSDGSVDVVLRARVRARALEEWAALCPGLLPESDTAHGPSRLHGDVDSHVAFNVAVGPAPRYRAHFELDAAALAFESPRLVKAAGAAAQVTVDVRRFGSASQSAQSVEWGAELGAGHIAYHRLERPNHMGYREWVRVEAQDIESLAKWFPELGQAMADWHGQGSAVFELRRRDSAGGTAWELWADFTDCVLARGGTLPVSKPAGTVFTVGLRGQLWPATDRAGSRIDVENGLVVLEDSTLIVEDGRLVFRPAADAMVTDPADLQAVVFEGRTRLRWSEALQGVWPFTEPQLSRGGPEGTLEGHVRWVSRDDSWSFEGNLDATRLAIDDVGGMAKPLDLSARAEWVLRSAPAWRGDLLTRQLQIETATLTLGGIEVHGSGTISTPGRDRWPTRADDGELQIAVDAQDLRTVSRLWPEAEGRAPAGALTAAMVLRKRPAGWASSEMELHFDDTSLKFSSAALSLSGRATCRGSDWQAIDVRVGLDDREFVLIVDPVASGRPLAGYLHGPGIDLAQDPQRLRTAAAELEALLRPMAGVQQAAALLDLPDSGHVQAHLGAVHVADNSLDLPGAIEEFVGQVSWQDDQLTGQGRGACAGGAVDIQVAGHATGPRWSFEVAEMAAGNTTQAWLRRSFPGLTPLGPVSFRHLATAHPGDVPGTVSATVDVVGRGEVIVDGGTLSGRAAPAWAIWVFPGLDLAKFQFLRMRDWFEVRVDGTVHHEAVFQGQYYHLYASGERLKENVVRYEIGIDLLASLESPYWVETRGGRIPLFDTRTVLGPDGEIVEEDVHYVPLRFVQGVLWQSNPIYTAYHAVRKRVLGRE